MGPETASTLTSKFSFYSAVLAASVLAPGLCLVTAATIALLHLQHPQHIWSFVLAETKDLSTPIAVVLGLNFLAISFIAGYMFRELSFWLIGLLEKLPRYAPLAAPELRRRLEIVCGQRSLDNCLRSHPQLAYYLGNPLPGIQEEDAPYGGGHRENRGLLAFEYCKRRLRVESPALAVDNIEAEINVLTSCLFPISFITVDLIWIGEFSVIVEVLAAIGCTGAWLGILTSIFRLRLTERMAAITNLAYSGDVPQSPSSS
ncbi:hypothetical protein [Streptomyces sp. NPDC051576]|uniref:hypothetical protein n=1 Tax=Streptomyces sp. NPDC051576 TaxID=3155803 RepID=UPI00342770D5